MGLPADNHVHSEWSWDAMHGSMDKTCERAQQLGLPSIAFTEHLDHTVWTTSTEALAGLQADHPFVMYGDDAGNVTPPPFDVEGYLTSLDHCRSKFPNLTILSGLEVGEPHRHQEAVDAVMAGASFDRVLGSLHSLPRGNVFEEPGELFVHVGPDDVMRDYLAEVTRLVTDSTAFTILAHIDYPVRYWPNGPDAFDPGRFEDEFRGALRATASSGRSLEINTVLPLHVQIVRWWVEEGGESVTFGSDAHEPDELAQNLAEAAAMAEALGFRPSCDLFGPWRRS